MGGRDIPEDYDDECQWWDAVAADSTDPENPWDWKDTYEKVVWGTGESREIEVIHRRPTWDEYPCIEWQGKRHVAGYGITDDRKQLAHRMTFELFYGYMPQEPFVVDHMCRNRLCVEPMHLQEITRAENTRLGTTRQNRTHCNYGHDDWTVKKSGHRRCAECHRVRARGDWPPIV